MVVLSIASNYCGGDRLLAEQPMPVDPTTRKSVGMADIVGHRCCLVCCHSQQMKISCSLIAEVIACLSPEPTFSAVKLCFTLLNRVLALIGWGKGGNVTSVGWQVTLCDPVWHVTSRSGEAVCELLYTRYLLTYLLMLIKMMN